MHACIDSLVVFNNSVILHQLALSRHQQYKASSDTHNWSLAFIEGEGLHHVHSPLFDLAYILLCYNR